MKEKTTPERLAEDHWEWIEGFWESFPNDASYGLCTVEYLYKTAFIHGYKHGREAGQISDAPEFISDGFGTYWRRICGCGGERHVTRPGKVQCDKCGHPK